MFFRVRQHSFLAAAFCGAVALSLALPMDQFIDLARLVIQVGLAFTVVVAAVFVAPGLICGDWFGAVRRTVRAMRLAQGRIPVRLEAFTFDVPCGVFASLFRPPRSIS